ncbi:MAG: glycosyltransferase family 2 protein [Pseudomonadota bacterium]
MTRWGICTTTHAPTRDILHFAAFHLEAGAHRIYLYLDAPNPDALAHLDAHPKIRAILCDDARWRGRRPQKHQVRQSQNATHAYRRKQEVGWLIHMDVDEFLIAQRPIAQILQDLPKDTALTRVRPMEGLAGDGTAFKSFMPPGPERARLTRMLYPTFGAHLTAGFLSHVAGKIFVRTGLKDVRFQIHNAFQADAQLQGPSTTAGLDLAHCHAKSWEDWIAAFSFRLAKGAYRTPDKGCSQLHELLSHLHQSKGAAGLSAFFDEVVADTPALRARLTRHGCLRTANTGLKHTIAHHFPSWSPY